MSRQTIKQARSKDDWPSIRAAKKRYAHGTHARYVLARCRCEPCRESNREYERTRQLRRQLPYVVEYNTRMHLWVVRETSSRRIVHSCKTKITAKRHAENLNSTRSDSCELIPVEPVVRHIRWLQDLGIGVKTIGKTSTVSQSVLNRMLEGNIQRTRRSTAAKVLNVSPEAIQGGARIRSDETLVLIERLIDAGYTRTSIAHQLGYTSNVLQIGKTGWIQVRSAKAVHELYEHLVATTPGLPPAGPFRIGTRESTFARKGGTRQQKTPIALEHGTAGHYENGCRCKACCAAFRSASTAKERQRGLRYAIRLSQGTKTWIIVDRITGATIYGSTSKEKTLELRDNLNSDDPASSQKMLVDATPAREHIHRLINAGTGTTAIARATGLDPGHVGYLANGRLKRTTKPALNRILALIPGELPPGGRIEAGPTWELLDRLTAAGFERKWIATLLGLPSSAFAQRGRTVSLARARDLLVLYTTLRARIPALRELEPTSEGTIT